MSFFSWLFPHKPAKQPAPPASSGLSRMESTKPYNGKQPVPAADANARPANRKNERMARRELLYVVVREAMVKAGVLSSSYKFKVLSLDPRGRQFMVMVDLSQGSGADTTRLAEIEAAIAQQAKARYDILITAVYWRSNEHVAVGDTHSHRPAAQATPSRPMPLDLPVAASEQVSQPAELLPAPVERHNGRYDPLHPDEVAAFKRALAGGASGASALAAAQPASQAAYATTTRMQAQPQPPAHGGGASARGFDGSAKHGPQSYTLLTGFEDTEMPEQDVPAGSALSATQYGDLR